MCKTSITGKPIGYFNSLTGDLEQIQVLGSADCDYVRVRFHCLNDFIGEKIVPVHFGFWHANHPAVRCGCEDVHVITVDCWHHTETCEFRWEGLLDCRALSNCPSSYAYVFPQDLLPERDCNEDYTRSINGIAVKDPSSIPLSVFFWVESTNGSNPKPLGTTAQTTLGAQVSFSVSLPPGEYFIKGRVQEVQCTDSKTFLVVPQCPGCPDIKINDPTAGPCFADGTRELTFKADIPAGVGASQLMHGTVVLDQGNSQAPYVLEGKVTAPAGSNVSVVVRADKFSDCPEQQKSATVPSCKKEDDRVVIPPPPPPPPTDDGGGWGCLVSRIMVLIAWSAGVFLAMLALCSPPPVSTVLLVSAGVALLVAAGLQLVWLAFCAKRCGLPLLMWQVWYVAAWLAAFMLACCPPALIVLIACAIATLTFFLAWRSTCKPSFCVVVAEILWATSVPVGMMLSVYKNWLPCGMPANINSVYQLVLAILAAISAGCVIKSR